MEFGYGPITAQCPVDDERSHEQVYDEAVRLAQLAEENGFDVVWTSEHHFFEDGYSPSVFPFSASLATATSSIDIGTSVALAPLYDPVRLAEDAATVDLLSGGRFRLGLANGYMQSEFDTFDVPISERARRVEESIEICRRAWEDGSFSYEGEIFEYDDLPVQPKPAQDGGPPIYLGGMSEPVVERTTRLADGHISVIYNDPDFSFRASIDQFRQNFERFDEERDLTSDDFTLYAMQYAHVAETAEQSWDELRPALIYSRGQYAKHDEGDASKWIDMDDDVLQGCALWGDPDDVVEGLRDYDEEFPGELGYLARLWYPTLSFEQHADLIRLFGDEIIPKLS